MEILNNLVLGIGTAFTLSNLLWCFLGVVLGTAVGVLPGLGPFAAISILLPITYYLDPISGMIMLAGLYYGTQYGGSTTSILLNLPGESSSVITTIDGYKMTQNGRGGSALAISAIGSFVSGCFATLLIAFIASPLAAVAVKFGPTEYAALMFLGLIASATLSKGSLVKSLSMVILGVLLGSVGIDINSGVERFTFGIPNLYDGIPFVILAMSMFGLAEIVYNYFNVKEQKVITPKIKDLYPSKQEFKEAYPAILRGTGIGSLLGILPGAGAVISSFASYSIEKRLSKNPEKFGNGAIEGVAGPESANNAGAQTSFIPMLSLGLPTTPVMALMIAALLIHDIQPGPSVIESNSLLFWALIASMWIGNLFLLILNLPLVGLWIKLISIPRKFLYPTIIIFCIIGAYYISNNWFGVFLLIPFTILGYFFKKWQCEPAPLAMGFVLGAPLEEYFRRALMLSDGSFMTFFERPISLSLILVTVTLIVVSLRSSFKN